MMTREIVISIRVLIIWAGCITVGVVLVGTKSTNCECTCTSLPIELKPLRSDMEEIRWQKEEDEAPPKSEPTPEPKPKYKPVSEPEPEIIIYTNFTLFNWTNPDEFNKTGIKPNFTKLGPYVLRHQKFDEASYSEPTVSKSIQTWYFEPTMSKGSLDDTVIMPHVVTAILASIMKNSNESEKAVLNNLMKENGGKLYSVKKVRELIFGWQDDSLLDYLDSRNITKYEHDIECRKCEYFFKQQFPKEFSGNSRIQQTRPELSKINGEKFYSSKCEISIGNEFLSSQQSFRLRLLNISHGRIVHHNGNIENGCEFTGSYTDKLKSLSEWTGVIDLNGLREWYKYDDTYSYRKVLVADCSKCHNNCPIYASFPNFYLYDSEHRVMAQFIMPYESGYQYSFILERESGKILQTKEGFQMNLLIQRDENFDFYKNVPEENTTMPLYYTEQIVKYNYYDNRARRSPPKFEDTKPQRLW